MFIIVVNVSRHFSPAQMDQNYSYLVFRLKMSPQGIKIYQIGFSWIKHFSFNFGRKHFQWRKNFKQWRRNLLTINAEKNWMLKRDTATTLITLLDEWDSESNMFAICHTFFYFIKPTMFSGHGGYVSPLFICYTPCLLGKDNRKMYVALPTDEIQCLPCYLTIFFCFFVLFFLNIARFSSVMFFGL